MIHHTNIINKKEKTTHSKIRKATPQRKVFTQGQNAGSTKIEKDTYMSFLNKVEGNI